MKTAILMLMRLAMLGVPAYVVYQFMQGEGSSHDLQWWIDNAGFIAWALGSFLILIWATSSPVITNMQVIILALGGAALSYFYLTRDIYAFFLQIPFFEQNKKALPVIPYAITVVVLILAMLFKRRYKKAS